ncbi:hypothetical protein Glove_606g5 [Diversispora epigaea]|uniref:Uncharacterized protein n=1 Tax=Diversispora epigaea TaxID=1348612 RepID=A0A397G9M4_9GLOM|nr:hypothetical protein Glove_606g5 [Diversispora epigaea]
MKVFNLNHKEEGEQLGVIGVYCKEKRTKEIIDPCYRGTTEGSNRHLVFHHGLYSMVLTTSACENRHIGNVATLRC